MGILQGRRLRCQLVTAHLKKSMSKNIITIKNLDLVLKRLKKSDNYIDGVSGLSDLPGFKNQEASTINLISKYLKEDGLITTSNGYGENEYKIKLTIKGYLFIKAGGYRREVFNKWINVALKIISTVGVIIGIILGIQQLLKSPSNSK